MTEESVSDDGRLAQSPPIHAISADLLGAPLAKPIEFALGNLKRRSALLVCIQDTEGVKGWGEVWCGFPEAAGAYRLALLMDSIAPALLGERAAPATLANTRLRQRLLAVQALTGDAGAVQQILAGLDCALWDLQARRRTVSLARALGGVADRVAAYASGLNRSLGETALADARRSGFAIFKLKVGRGTDEDARCIRRASHALQEHEQLALDANGNWTAEEAVDVLGVCDQSKLAFVEEPLSALASSEEWTELRLRTDLPLAAGESLHSEEEFIKAMSWLQIVQPDLGKWGGITGVHRVVSSARARGLRYFPHCFGSAVGLCTAAHALAALDPEGLLELDINANPLRTELVEHPCEAQTGAFLLPSQPGFGPEPSPKALDRWRIHSMSTR